MSIKDRPCETCKERPAFSKGICRRCYNQKHYAENRDRSLNRNKQWRVNNRERSREIIRKGWNKWITKPENKQKAARYQREWCQKNLDKLRVRSNIRNNRIKEATPDWLSEYDREQIKLTYIKAKQISASLGTKFSVDHIVPIFGYNVCGLHVPWNLQIITVSENCSKGRKLVI